MREEQKDEIKFERFNSKYNRIWEQLTNIGLFVLATVSAYIIALGTIEQRIDTVLTLTQVNYLLFGIAIVVGIASGVLITHLQFARKEIRDILKANNLI
ncbi:MAG: hypothetical protein AABY07_06180 [Nanoarchaeota archaeon]